MSAGADAGGLAARPDVEPPIVVAAAIIERSDGMLLFVRKHGTTAFLQPGGKLEPGETADAALSRELEEELGLVVPVDRLTPLGLFTADAANEPGRTIEAWVFDAPLPAEPDARAEIAELAWVDPAEFGDRDIAPLSRDLLIPLVLARR